MSYQKASPAKSFLVGITISILSILGYFSYQHLTTGREIAISSVKSPVAGIQVSNWLSGNADGSAKEAGPELFVNGMGMKFVRLPGLEIAFGIHEVTREQFRFFAESVGMEELAWLNRITPAGLSQEDNHPVVNVSWEEATRFCEWLSKQEGIAFRLPTDYEWSVAAGLDRETSFLSPGERSEKAAAKYFWGNKWQTGTPVENYADKSHETMTGSTGCFPFDDGFPATAPVGSFPPNHLGIFDMGGNVSEWVYDWFRGRDEFKTIRGASFSSGMTNKEVHRIGFRSMSEPSTRSERFGFRIVAEISDKLHRATGEEAISVEKSEPVLESAIAAAVLEYDGPVIEPPVPNESIATVPLPYEDALIQKKAIRVTYTGKDGINVRKDRSFGSGNILGAILKQSTIPLQQIGEDSRVDTETWVNVEVTGWMPTKNSTHIFLKDQGDGTWRVVWNKPGDRFVAMRSGVSSDNTLICKVSYDTVVEEIEAREVGNRHYIKATFTGWAVKKNVSRSYISDIR